MKTIKQILDSKGRTVHSVTPSDTVYRAIECMAEHAIGALLVMDGKRLAGIISERDYARQVILKGRSSRETTVESIMSLPVVTTTEEKTVEQCMAVMTEKRIRHLPVVSGDEVVGIVSLGDLVKTRLEEQKFLIEQLEQYISG